jgi:hypothetical protein
MADSEAQVLVQDHGDFVSAMFPNGETQTLSWSDLTRFEIQTNDSGPEGWDVWFVLIGARDRVSFPHGATGEDGILARIEKVTGKSRRDLIDGMNCTENCTFITWEKAATS